MALCKICKNFSSENGFSWLEIIITIAILGIILVLLLPSFNLFKKQNSLDIASSEILETLSLAQSKTLASEEASVWGINFSSNQFTLFKGESFIPDNPNNEIHLLPANVIFSEISLNGGDSIIFNRLTGATNSYGIVKISLENDSSQFREIFIDEAGIFGLKNVSPSDQERIKDSRHVHLNYEQNTKNATTLSLSFPLDGVTKNINYQDYLNSSKTEFLWEGDVLVAGSNQHLKIHSHGLSQNATLFCIHRERDLNSRALTINLDGQNLINYAADGTTTPGTSLWASQPEWQ